ncbi:phage baseplate assembly protein V [Desulfococcus multivorans]|uniref:Baseplate assembly protein V n=1 Tax=Desulfococcus multivorans DSM 2059 TaxID=1121405 RepID=S7VEZ3_DESML|nr:phage baseplate assembly protein V [Desulfococcus multivorans]AOY59401.1 conserved uncharacterized protein [Desulfococcus multivorans]AQV01610.1 hypothetical protein B2D07_13145 [Desulfococcus multivorans]EPR43048.1 baseplate assembly protein V [Desulfococcus multivorans DSM 2059]SKA00001.1 hypothetical protein SAMN02745446_02358 [Desulfococcus multivorans DSM 2059]
MPDLRQALFETASRQRYYGKYRGRVLDNDDPLNIGRVMVEVPAIGGGEPLGWALPCLPYAGDGHGLYMVPEVDALVWVEFEGGDLSHPIWVGCFWASDQLPEGAAPGVFMLRTAGGNVFRISDADEAVDLSTASGHVITISDGDDAITLKHAGGASITVEGDTITIDGGNTKIVLDGRAVNVNDGSLEVT